MRGPRASISGSSALPYGRASERRQRAAETHARDSLSRVLAGESHSLAGSGRFVRTREQLSRPPIAAEMLPQASHCPLPGRITVWSVNPSSTDHRSLRDQHAASRVPSAASRCAARLAARAFSERTLARATARFCGPAGWYERFAHEGRSRALRFEERSISAFGCTGSPQTESCPASRDSGILIVHDRRRDNMGVAGEHRLTTLPRSHLARHALRRTQPATVESSPSAP